MQFSRVISAFQISQGSVATLITWDWRS